jgi:hypothetical protein
MATKYIVNTKKMAFQFANGKVLERKGVLAVDEEELERMEKDYFFASLKEKGVISVSLVKPSDYSTPAEIIASDNAKIKDLEKTIAELKAKLAEAEATGKETATVIDSDAPVTVEAPTAEEEPVVEEETKTSKKGKNK